MKPSAKPVSLLLALAGAVMLSACGVKGDLSVPAPMWGKPDPDKSAATLPDDDVLEQASDGQPLNPDDADGQKTDATTPDGG